MSNEIEIKLYQYQEYKRQIEELENQIAEIMDKHDAMAEWMKSAPTMSDIRVKGGPLPDPVFKAVQKMVDVYGTRIDALRVKLVDVYYMHDEIIGTVTRAVLTDQERQYIQLRYFDGLRPSKVAAEMGYAEGHIRKLKNNAILKIGAVLVR